MRVGSVVLALALAAGGAGAQSLRFDTPPGCTMEGAPGRMACTWQHRDGSLRSVAALLTRRPVEDLASGDRAALEADPAGWMTADLAAAERAHAARPPKPGQAILATGHRALPAAELPPGADSCLRYDFDYSDATTQFGHVRIDNTGLWCQSLRDGALHVVQVEVLALHGVGPARLPGFEAEAARVLGSLRIDW